MKTFKHPNPSSSFGRRWSLAVFKRPFSIQIVESTFVDLLEIKVLVFCYAFGRFYLRIGVK